MFIFDIDAVRRALDAMDSSWKEFMRVESMSAGVYRLKAGERQGFDGREAGGVVFRHG